MTGCRFNAKNTLDKNYLHLAEKKGLRISPESEVVHLGALTTGGYEVRVKEGRGFLRKTRVFRARQVVMSGGVLGTLGLLLRMREKKDGLPRLSPRLGEFVRTNSEVLMGVVSRGRDVDYTEGVAITSIVHTDEHSHVEPVRYSKGSGFFRIMMAPHAPGETALSRLVATAATVVRHPWLTLRTYIVPDLARHSIIMLYMRALEGHLTIKLGRGVATGFRRGLTTILADGPAPTASIPEATEIARLIAEEMDGQPISMLTETVFGTPTTAHILGGCTMGSSAESGVIDDKHRVFGYEGLYVVDGSSVSANPGVNPSLTITAMAERAMSHVAPAA